MVLSWSGYNGWQPPCKFLQQLALGSFGARGRRGSLELIREVILDHYVTLSDETSIRLGFRISGLSSYCFGDALMHISLQPKSNS